MGRKSFFQDIACGIVISVHDQTAIGTHMRADTQRLFDDGITVRTLLAGVLRWDGNDRDSMHDAIGGKPVQEYPPTSIMDTLGKVPVADHSADVKVLIGNQVVRRDQRVCLFAGKIFALPLHFQISFCQCLAGFFAVLAPFLFPREPSMQSLELLFRFAIVTRIVNPVPFGVGQEGCESDINANCCARWHMLHLALSLDAQLAIVAISTLDKANSLDLLEREGGDCLFLVPYETKPPDSAA